MKKVYLAGPDVFRPNAKEHGEKLKAICLKHGLEGLYPLDKEIPPAKRPPDTARAICYANIDLIVTA
jgi:nucleoside 2-deoxyribosyltransferase